MSESTQQRASDRTTQCGLAFRAWMGPSCLLASSILSSCGGGGTAPAPATPSTALVVEVVARDASGSLTGVPGIEVHRNNSTTGAFVETRTTDAAGRADFGSPSGASTISLVRKPVGGVGATRAYTLLGVPAGTMRVRLDRLAEDPGKLLSTADMGLSPPLSSTERASACLPGGCTGTARPNATSIVGVPFTNRDLQDDGRVTVVSQVLDDETGEVLSCRVAADIAVPANGTTFAAQMNTVAPAPLITTGGALSVDRIVAHRKGAAHSIAASGPGCASAFSTGGFGSSGGAAGTSGFLLHGAGDVDGGLILGSVNYYDESWGSSRTGALWLAGSTLDTSIARTLPAADAKIAALSYAAGVLRFTLKGTQVQPLVAARSHVAWAPATPHSYAFLYSWFVYSSLTVGAASCDGTGADPGCSHALPLPDLSAQGMPLPPDRSDMQALTLEVMAPAGINRAVDFWDRLALEGDVEAVLAGGYTGAVRESSLREIAITLTTGSGINNDLNFALGRVSGTASIDCGGPAHPYYTPSCDATLPEGTLVTLTATPNAGAEFVEWQGLCAASASPGATTVSFALLLGNPTQIRSQACVPKFRAGIGSFMLNVIEPQGTNGLITSDDGFINCGRDISGFPQTRCSFNYSSGMAVRLNVARTSNDGNGYTIQWTGDCTGAETATTVVMAGGRNCSVIFAPVPK